MKGKGITLKEKGEKKAKGRAAPDKKNREKSWKKGRYSDASSCDLSSSKSASSSSSDSSGSSSDSSSDDKHTIH